MLPPPNYTPGQLARWVALQTLVVLVMVFPLTAAALNYFYGGDFHNLRDGFSTIKFISGLALFETLLICPVTMVPVFMKMRELTAAREILDQLANADPLTGLLNRRGFDAAAARFVDAAGVVSGPFAVLICDLDFFKRVNDDFGHEFGDAALRHAAKILREETAQSEAVLGRLGGEEFVVVLPGYTLERAGVVAERLRSRFAASPVESNGQLASVTMSVGFAAASKAGARVAQLIAGADSALYEAKRSGRNRIDGAADPVLIAA